MTDLTAQALVKELSHNVPMQIALDGNELVALLQAAGAKIPKLGVTVEVIVPGGADWSNCGLDITKENPILIRWEERKTFVPKDSD